MKRFTARPSLLREGTEAHYRDAEEYDRAYRRRREDVELYVDLAVEHGGPVLELGSGTGRVAIEIARRGIDVVGIELVAAMRKRAREVLAREPKSVRDRVKLVAGDIRRARLRRRFPLVISPFNVFMHLYSRADVERGLATVRAHLARRGRFVFDVLMPDVDELASDPARTYRGGVVTRPSDGRRFKYGEAFDYDPIAQVQLVTMIFADEKSPESSFVTPLAHRQFFPAELEALLHYNGFTIESRWGDFERCPLEHTSESQIIVARATRK